MLEAIKVLEVRMEGDNVIVVTFSDGRSARYSAARLSVMGGVSQRPVAILDHVCVGDVK